jgi:rare lipoprotein A
MKPIQILLFLAVCLLTSQWSHSQNTEVGMASFYHDMFEGRTTASGDIYSGTQWTAAHRTLPFNTQIRVTNLENNYEIVVTVNDRGPFVDGRILDLSKAAANSLDFIDKGLTKIKLEVVSSE